MLDVEGVGWEVESEISFRTLKISTSEKAWDSGGWGKGVVIIL